MSTFVAGGKHRVVLRGSGEERTIEVEVAAGKVEELTLSTTGSGAAKPQIVAKSSSASESPGQLLAKARSALKRGETGAALSAYRNLRKTYPNSPEAATVLVTMGKLELRQNSPASALTAFDSYLKRGGPLRPEALAGRVRALRALGRTAEERRAIESYLASYPKGFEALALKKRLSALSSR
jgi:predicted Zn-dependent protease